MERSPLAPMTLSNEPNPLRPYYRAPSISDRVVDVTPNFSAPGGTSFGSSARDLLSDLNYGELLGDSSPTTGESIRGLLNAAFYRYSSVFLAQPFDISKMVLQARCAGSSSSVAAPSSVSRQRGSVDGYSDGDEQRYRSEEDEDDDDEPSYFTSAAPQDTYTPPTPSGRSRSSASRNTDANSTRRPFSPYKLDLKRNNAVLDVLSQLWQREGAWGVWKGTNVTFLYSLLLKTVETWTRSMLAALLNLPDPGLLSEAGGGVGGLDILDSPLPFASLGVVVVAAGVAGLLLAPLDIVRTRIILTSVVEQPRSIMSCLRSLSLWTCPTSLLLPTVLHSTLPTLISTSTPLFLRSNLRIDPIITPTSYSTCTFLSSVLDLFITLPFETVLRRGQMSVAAHAGSSASTQHRRRSRSTSRRPHQTEDHQTPLNTIVDIGPYYGVFGTMWHIAREEGETYTKTAAMTRGAPGTHAHRPVYSSQKGQGVQGLWRGWRVGMWGLVGVWGAAAMGASNSKGGEF